MPACRLIFVLVLFTLAAASLPAEKADVPAQAGLWAFEPGEDLFSPDALLDLRYMNEAFAGEHGYIRATRDGGFESEKGGPIRFWAVNSYVWKDKPDQLENHARFLAKRGVNMVRYHSTVFDTEASSLKGINESERDKLWRLVAAMKKEGIYLTISMYYPHSVKLKAEWGLEAEQENMTGLLFFHPAVQEAYWNWWREVLVPPNPYTGVSLKDEPAIAILQLQNEDSLLFWTFSQIKGKPRLMLEERFAKWAEKKFGSLEKTLERWKNEKLPQDSLNEGRLGLRDIWDMTLDGFAKKALPTQRLADQAQFMAETMYDWNESAVKFLRKEIGAKQLINAGNWKTADPVTLEDLERWSYTAADVTGVNRYAGCYHKGTHDGWAIVNGDRFTKGSLLLRPMELPFNVKQSAKHPMIIPESLWVPPTLHQSEGPFLVAAYTSLTGVDGFYWFATSNAQWRQPSSANGYLPSLGKWVFATPQLLGNFPGAALLYRNGYVKKGKPVLVEHRTLEDMAWLKIPAIAENKSFDPNRDKGVFEEAGREGSQLSRLAFLTGPILVEYGSTGKNRLETGVHKLIDDKRKIVNSITGELALDWGRGICTLNTACAQGVSGHLDQGSPHMLKDVKIVSRDEYASVIVVSLDGSPIVSSDRILVQVGTACRPSGWEEKAATWKDGNSDVNGFEIVNFGKAPWMVVESLLELEIANKGLVKATALDPNGMPTGSVELVSTSNGVKLVFPRNSMYVVLE